MLKSSGYQTLRTCIEESGHQPETLRRAAPQHDGSCLLMGRVRMHLWLDADGLWCQVEDFLALFLLMEQMVLPCTKKPQYLNTNPFCLSHSGIL